MKTPANIEDKNFQRALSSMCRPSVAGHWSLSRSGNMMTISRTTYFSETTVTLNRGSVGIDRSLRKPAGPFSRIGPQSFLVPARRGSIFFDVLENKKELDWQMSFSREANGVRAVLRELARDMRAHPGDYQIGGSHKYNQVRRSGKGRGNPGISKDLPHWPTSGPGWPRVWPVNAPWQQHRAD
jgi:hypothetical protein